MNDVAISQEAETSKPANPAADTLQEDQRGLSELLSDISALEAIATDWPSEQRNAVHAHARAVEELNAEAFRRIIRALKSDPAAAEALRAAAADELVYAVLRRHNILKPSMFERVEAALDGVRPMLASHGGDVELVSVEPPLVEVRFLGACDGCPASALTFYGGVKKAIQDNVPEIKDIKQVKGIGGGDSDTVHFTSPFANYKTGSWSFAAKLGDLADGQTITRELGDHSILLSRFGDRVTCFANVCAHMGLALDGGEIEAGIITCPFHGFQYALESGECLTAPEVQLKPHGVKVVGDRIEVQLAL